MSATSERDQSSVHKLFQRAVSAIESGEHFHAIAISEQIGNLAKGLDSDAFDPIKGRVKHHGSPEILGIRVAHAGGILNQGYVIEPDGRMSVFRVIDHNQQLLDFETARTPTDHDLIHDKEKLIGAMRRKIDDIPKRRRNARRRALRARRAEAIRQAAAQDEAEREAFVIFDALDPNWQKSNPEGPIIDSVPWAWHG